VGEEIARLQKEPISEDELTRARTAARAQLVGTFASSMSLATSMGELAVYYNKPELINQQAELYQRVTAADIQRVANQYLQPSNRGVLITRPAAKAQPSEPAGGTGGKK